MQTSHRLKQQLAGWLVVLIITTACVQPISCATATEQPQQPHTSSLLQRALQLVSPLRRLQGATEASSGSPTQATVAADQRVRTEGGVAKAYYTMQSCRRRFCGPVAGSEATPR